MLSETGMALMTISRSPEGLTRAKSMGLGKRGVMAEEAGAMCSSQGSSLV